MGQKTFFSLVILGFVIIVLGLLFFALNTDRETTETLKDLSTKETLLGEGTEQSITAKHQFKEGTHIVAGEFNLPTPCHLLKTRAVIRESTPRQVVVEFNVVSQDGGLCAQVITPVQFKFIFDAAERAIITATINGDPVILNLLQIGKGEDLGDL